MIVLNINSAAISRHADRLGRMNNFALPVVVRQTLSKAAFNVKQDTMLKTSNVFIHRRATFFKSNSKAVPAQGFDISRMYSVVGFVPKANDKSHSVEDLAVQENGGVIKNRSLIALPLARVSNSWSKMVRNEAFMQRVLGHLIHAKNSRASSEQARFTKAAVYAGLGGFVISEERTNSGGHVVFLITGINRFGGNNHIQAIPVFSVKRNRMVAPKPTHFMSIASIESAKKMNGYFTQLANERLAKA